MGCGHSKAASAVQSQKSRGKATHSNISASTKKTFDDSTGVAIITGNTVVGAKPVLDPASDIPQRRSSARQGRPNDWAVQPGYSSGASSLDGSGDDESEGGGSSGGLPVRNALDRSKHSERLGLGELRQSMAENGDICQAVVRIETSFGKPIEEIYDGVHDGPVLGSGVAGVVRLISHRATGLKYAVKTLDLAMIDTVEGLKQLRDEIFIMCQLDHPNIVRIDEVYESTNEIYIVQELMVGGDLFDRLDEQPDYHYTEAQCARLVKMMISSVRYLHSKGIVHRDLKLENFLFVNKGRDSDLKMIDFGLSKHFDLGQTHTEMVGTPYTVAPEILRGTYDEKCDCWAIGVITYLLLSGETPFGGLDGENMHIVRQNIIRAQVTFKPADVWANVSAEGKAFVKKMLQADPKKRPSAKEAQKDEWIQVWAKKDAKEGGKLNEKTVKSLMAFKESSDMQKILSEVLSFTLLPEQMLDLKSEFEKIDTDGDGEISLDSLKKVLLESAEAGSLGSLTEEEIDEIFDAIRVKKSEPTIRWHEFLAAGLSQARVDDRNLRIAFDRLDSDRKGFISFEDMQGLVGGMTDSEELERIWKDCLVQCRSHLNQITFDSFKRLMKGQAKNDRRAAYLPLHGPRHAKDFAPGDSLPFMLSEKSLEMVPEGVQVDTPLHMSDDEDEIFPMPRYAKKRSRSFEEKAASWHDTMSKSESAMAVPASIVNDASRSFLASAEGLDAYQEMDGSALLANRSLYRKHRELRLSVLEASKQFDKKRAEIQQKGPLATRASLIMKRGAAPPVELEDAHRRALFEAAANRAGRLRKGQDRRKKTVSDVTGLLSQMQ